MTAAERIKKLMETMDPARRSGVRDSVHNYLRAAAIQEALNQMSEAIEAASKAGLSDEEIVEYIQKTLRQRAHIRKALIFNRRASS